MIGNGCMIGPPAATGKGIQIVGIVPNDVTDGLIHRWPLTSNANDIIGTLHMTNNGSVTFSENGASFNGSNQWLSCTKTRPSQFTMMSWITPVNFSARRSAFSACNADGAPASAWGWYDGELTAMNVMACSISQYIYIANELNTNNYPTNNKTLSVVTYNGVTLTAYRNELQIGATSCSAATGSTSLSIGRIGAYPDGYWYGTIADARLYNRALTANEISILAGNGPNP